MAKMIMKRMRNSPKLPNSRNLASTFRKRFMNIKIGIYEFTLMPTDEQANYLWDNGEYITHSIREGMRYQLHVLSNFYVEVTYDSTENCIVDLKSFKTSRLLEPYLSHIDIGDLM